MEIDIILNEFTSPHEAVELGLMAERSGVRGIWSSNYGWSRDAFLTLALLAERQDEVSQETLAVIEENLRILDQAIAQIHTALDEDPGSRNLNQLLAARYRQEVGLLSQMSRHI